MNRQKVLNRTNMKFQIRERNKTSVILLRSQDPNKYCPLLPWPGLLMRFPIWQWVRVLHRILSNA